jgi:hypothetical protein
MRHDNPPRIEGDGMDAVDLRRSLTTTGEEAPHGRPRRTNRCPTGQVVGGKAAADTMPQLAF